MKAPHRREDARHIIWDWNGTLLNDGSHIMASVNEAFEAMGLGRISVELHQSQFHRPIDSFFGALSPRELSSDELDQLMVLFQSHYARQPLSSFLKAETRALLATLHQWHVPQSVLSMCPQSELEGAIAELGLGACFQHVCGHPGFGPDTKAEHLRQHLRRLGRRPDEVVVIGDTVDDHRAAQHAGVRCVLVDRKYASLEAKWKLQATGSPIFDRLVDAAEFALSEMEPVA